MLISLQVLFFLSVGNLAKNYLIKNEINWWLTPPESPDINPIEMMWNELKVFLRRHIKPSNKEELVNGIVKFWTQKVDVEKCNRYINHIPKVLPIIVERDGRASGH